MSDSIKGKRKKLLQNYYFVIVESLNDCATNNNFYTAISLTKNFYTAMRLLNEKN